MATIFDKTEFFLQEILLAKKLAKIIY